MRTKRVKDVKPSSETCIRDDNCDLHGIPRYSICEKHRNYVVVGSVAIYIIDKIWNIWKSQWKHSYLTLKFAGNGLESTTNKCCDFNATITCSVMVKMQLAIFEIKDNEIYRNVSFMILRLKLPKTSGLSIIALCCESVIFLRIH